LRQNAPVCLARGQQKEPRNALCTHDTLCVSLSKEELCIFIGLHVIWRQIIWRENDVNSDNQQRDVLTPILLAFSIAYILHPVVDRLEAWKVPRPAGIAIVLGGMCGALILFLALVLPDIAADVASVIQELPRQLAALWTRLAPWLEQQGIAVPRSTTEWVKRLNALATEIASPMLAPASSFISSFMSGTLSVLGSGAAALVMLVLAVYLLNDFNRITTGIRELFHSVPWRRLRLDSRGADVPARGLAHLAAGWGHTSVVLRCIQGIDLIISTDKLSVLLNNS
jgi:hypothetical protein